MKTTFRILIAIFLFPSLIAHAESVIKTFKAEKITNFKLKNLIGDTKISGKNTTEIKVQADKIKWHKDCELVITQAGETIAATVEEKKYPGIFSRNTCMSSVRTSLMVISPFVISAAIAKVTTSFLSG